MNLKSKYFYIVVLLMMFSGMVIAKTGRTQWMTLCGSLMSGISLYAFSYKETKLRLNIVFILACILMIVCIYHVSTNFITYRLV